MGARRPRKSIIFHPRKPKSKSKTRDDGCEKESSKEDSENEQIVLPSSLDDLTRFKELQDQYRQLIQMRQTDSERLFDEYKESVEQKLIASEALVARLSRDLELARQKEDQAADLAGQIFGLLTDATISVQNADRDVVYKISHHLHKNRVFEYHVVKTPNEFWYRPITFANADISQAKTKFGFDNPPEFLCEEIMFERQYLATMFSRIMSWLHPTQ